MRPAGSCASCRWRSIPPTPSSAIFRSTTGYANLREIAVGRLLLDNVEHVKAFWIMITPGVAQMALWYGADDLDGTVSHYEITHALGTRSHRQVLTVEQTPGSERRGGSSPGGARCAVQCREQRVSASATSAISRLLADRGKLIAERECHVIHDDPNLTDIEDKILAGRAAVVRRRRALVPRGESAPAFRRGPTWSDIGLHPERRVTYVVGRVINYTNVCWVQCKFCNFYRLPGQEGGYVLPRETMFGKIRELMEPGRHRRS